MTTRASLSDEHELRGQVTGWWAHVLRGAFAIGFGLFALMNPGVTAVAIIVAFSIYALADGFAAVAASLGHGAPRTRRGWFLIEGIVSLAAAAIAFAFPAATFFVLLVVVAVRALVLGIIGLVGSLSARRSSDWRGLWALSSVVSIAFGAMLLARPLEGALAVLWMIGAYAVVAGITMIGFGLHLRWGERHEHGGVDVPTTSRPATT